MPFPVMMIRRRRETRSESRTFPVLGRAVAGLITFFAVLVLGVAFIISLAYARLVRDLPSVGNIEILFAESPTGFLEPIQVYDRSQIKLFDLLHPDAVDRRWLKIGESGIDVIPRDLQIAIVSSHDQSFWTNPGYDLRFLLNRLFRFGNGESSFELPRSITQRLIELTILPSEDFLRSDLWRYLREAILADRLTDRYSKEQILEWYINSVGYGNIAYGADAASLVYFGKHASELTLFESAFLAAMSIDPWTNYIKEPEIVEKRITSVLHAMLVEKQITEEEARQSYLEELSLRDYLSADDVQLQLAILVRITPILGTRITDRAGLRIYTTIDTEIQHQLECITEFFIHRKSVNNFSPPEEIPDDEACLPFDLPTSLRSGEGISRFNIDEVAGTVMDTRSGEILGLYGGFEEPKPSASILYPFIYLAAFSRGDSPGTMVLDLPPDSMKDQPLKGSTPHGPVSMREALIGGYPYATHRLIQSLGLEGVFQVVEQLGISNTSDGLGGSSEMVFPEEYEISLLNAVYGYGVLASIGEMIGTPSLQAPGEMWRTLNPILIMEVKDQDGMLLYQSDSENRLIVSRELTFLVTDILKDNANRLPDLRNSTFFESARPSAVMNSMDEAGRLSWTIGYTPSRVVGVWVEKDSSDGDNHIGDFGTASALWQALMKHVTENLLPEDWQQPPEIVQVEICEPSGMLPTAYCPSVVKEYFLESTVPSQVDSFYRPFQINQETGKLATLFTPMDLIVEKVFFVPPQEAMEWATQEGYLQPPMEYDALMVMSSTEKDVELELPRNFDIIRGMKWISGQMEVDGFQYYRLQYGEGLNPTYWTQIGENEYQQKGSGTLALWDTSQLDGLYALQLIVVEGDGIAHIDTHYVTVDNQAPEVSLNCPELGAVKEMGQGHRFSCDVQVFDDIEIFKVEFYLNDARIFSDFTSPFSIQLNADEASNGKLVARAYDLAGNQSNSEAFLFPFITTH